MANRDFKKIERIMKDFSLGVGEGGGSSSSGIILVNELPEVGNEDTLYKTPDGKIWSCVNTTEEKEILDLEVGKTFKFKNKILAEDINDFVNKMGEGDTYLKFSNDVGVYKSLVSHRMSPEDTGPVVTVFSYEEQLGTEPLKTLSYDATNVQSTSEVEAELDGFSSIPSVEITEILVDHLADEDCDLWDIAFAFVGGSHTETITTSTWTEVGGGAPTAFAFGSSTFCPECIGFEQANVDFDALATYMEEELNIDLDVTFITGEISFCTSLIGASASLRINVDTSNQFKQVNVSSYDNTNPFLTTTTIDKEANSLRDVFNELIKFSDGQRAVTLPHIYNANYTYDNICYIYRTGISDYEMFRLTDPEGFFKKILVEAGSSSGSDSSS